MVYCNGDNLRQFTAIQQKQLDQHVYTYIVLMRIHMIVSYIYIMLVNDVCTRLTPPLNL